MNVSVEGVSRIIHPPYHTLPNVYPVYLDLGQGRFLLLDVELTDVEAEQARRECGEVSEAS